MPSTVAISALPGQIVAGNMLKVVPKTSDYTLIGDAAASDCGKLFTNTGASGEVIFYLPAATVGLNYEFVVNAAQRLRIDAAGTDVIYVDLQNYLGTYISTAAGGYIRSSDISAYTRLTCFASGKWKASPTKDAITWAVDS